MVLSLCIKADFDRDLGDVSPNFMISYDEFANVLIIKSGKSVYC